MFLHRLQRLQELDAEAPLTNRDDPALALMNMWRHPGSAQAGMVPPTDSYQYYHTQTHRH